MPLTINTLRTVILYASSDAELQHEFRQHLTTLTKEKLIEIWSLDDVLPGADRERALQHALDDCDIVVLLLSADFDVIGEHLIDRALDQSTVRGLQVVPVLVRPLDFRNTRLRCMTTLPRGHLAVSQYASCDDAWTSVVGELRLLVHRALGLAVTTSHSLGHQETPRTVPARAAMLGQIGTIVEFDPFDALGWIELDQGGRVRFGGMSFRGIVAADSFEIGRRVEVHGTTPGYKGVPKAVAVVPVVIPGALAGPRGMIDETLPLWRRIRLIENSVQADDRIRRLEHHTIKSLHSAATRLQLDRRVLLGGISAQFVAALPLYPDPASQMLADLHELNVAPVLADGSTPLLTWLDNACILSECRSEFSLFSAIRQDLSRGGLGEHSGGSPRPPHLGRSTEPASRENEQIKYYIYVSATKVRMLYDQLPRSVSQGSAAPERNSLFSKATLACDYLRARSLVGTVGDGRPYFYGSMTMNWGVIRANHAQIVFFGAESDDMLIALVGSANSLVGNRRTAVESGHGLDFYLFTFFSDVDEHPEPSWLGLNTEAPTAVPDSRDMMYRGGIQAFNRYMTRVPHGAQRLEFIARTIVSHDDDGRRLVIGSPIYVALNDNAS